MENTYQPLHIVETIDLFKDEVELIKELETMQLKSYTHIKQNSDLDKGTLVTRTTKDESFMENILNVDLDEDVKKFTTIKDILNISLPTTGSRLIGSISYFLAYSSIENI